jgi:aldehyde oxidoreductase
MPTLNFSLNGTPTSVEYQQGMHFLEILRENLGVTSPKDGCAPQGVCGCCSILVNGKAVLACKRSPEQMEGAEVVTLEGIPGEHRSALSKAFERDGAVQCGFCIPGIVARASTLLARGGPVDRDVATKAITGNLCRCTGYSRIVDAIQTACEINDGSGDPNDTNPRRTDFFGEKFGLTRTSSVKEGGIGDVAPKYRGVEHAMGEKDYVGDMVLPDMLHGAVVLSEHARARIISIDTTEASGSPGVERVFFAADVPGERFVGLIKRDWPVFVETGEITRCVGDVLAFVVADTQFNARAAANVVRVEYEVLVPVVDPETALDDDSPKVHEGGNLLDVCAYARGDVSDALSNSAHVVEATYTTQRIEHGFMEPEACLVTPATGGVHVFSQGQGVHDDQKQISEILGIPPESVMVDLVTNGGAFGGKEDLSIQGQTALAAYRLQRPVRTVLTRDQSIRVHPKRHPIKLEYTVGADADGRLTAVRAKIIGDTGAYASVGMKVLERAAGHCCGPYRVPNVEVDARTVYTNNPPCGAMRGFGANQASFAIEGIMDTLAEQVGIDGYDIRERNILAPGDQFATGQLMTDSCGIRQTLEAVRDVFKNANHAGIGCGIKNTGIGNGMDDTGRVLIRIAEDATLEIVTGYTEMGQGLHTILRQVVAEETGLPLDCMKVRTDSSAEVLCGMTTASRATSLCTAAGQAGARKLAKDLESKTLQDLVGSSYLGEFVCDVTTKPGEKTDHPRTHMTFGYATQVVLMDDAGRIERVVAAHDVGRAINPLLCAGQIEGAVHMGLGYALSEDLPCTDGRPDSTDMKDLGILRARDTPQIDVILIEVPDELGGYGSKGVGEIGLVPTAGAVAGALRSFDGKQRFSLPMNDVPAAKGMVPKSRKPR